MVSFFGLRFGADKRKKKEESPQPWNQAEEYIGRRESYFPQLASGNRPRTSQGTIGSRELHPGDSSKVSDADFKGIRAVLLGTTAAMPAGTGPVLSPTLKTYNSDSNLRVNLGSRNLSSTSLNMPPRRLGDAASELGPRPGTAHSMPGSMDPKPPLHINLQLANSSTSAFGAPPKSPLAQDDFLSPSMKSDTESMLSPSDERISGNRKPDLHINLPNTSTATFGGSPKSPLGHFVPLTSPMKSDTESLLGDAPEKVADEIAARITRDEDREREEAAEERRQLEAELVVQKKKLEVAKRNLEIAKLRAACPSPPASIESEKDAPLAMSLGRTLSQRCQLPAHQDEGLPSKNLDAALTPWTPASGTSQWTPSTDMTPDTRRQGSVPTIEAPPPSPKVQLPSALTLDTTEPGLSERSNTDGHISSSLQMLRPSGPREQQRSATVPAPNTSRSPLFQQMSPFDIHSDESDDENDHGVDHRTLYGLPSPPLSHRQRPSEFEEDEGLPVLRTVAAKRDTTLVGGPGRTSLGLQIEEFEKSLQQAQAMSALENVCPPEISVSLLTAPRSRGNSSSSNYSEMSETESPMIIDAPLMSPKPFPLSPRPMGPRSTPANVAPTGRPTLEVRPESPFGAYFGSFTQQSADALPARVQTPENDPAGRPRPRLGAVKPVRPPLAGYGNVQLKKVATLAGHIRRPSPDEYGIHLKRTASPASTDAHDPFRADSPFEMDSPILKDVASIHGPDDGFVSTSTSLTSSPTAVASYSVFSPPPPLKERAVPQPPPAHFGPAPSAPPTSPLPVPARRRKDTFDMSGRPSPLTTPRCAPPPEKFPSLQQTSPEKSPGLRTSPSIVPSNPNWPLPGPSPSSFASKTSPGEGGFSARRSMARDSKRARTPAPINIMATRYADEIGAVGPWTPDVAAAASEDVSKTAFVGAQSEHFEIRADFSGWREELAPHQCGLSAAEGDPSSAIGVARGLSIKYDKVRERQRRARGHEKTKRMAIVKLDEEDEEMMDSALASPAATGEPLDRLRRPNHGLKSPMGFADEQGVRFI